MLPDILKEIVKTVDNLQIDKITVVDSGGSGQGVPAVFSQIAGSTPALLESLKTSTGIDIAGLLRRASESSVSAPQTTNPPATTAIEVAPDVAPSTGDGEAGNSTTPG